MDFTAVSSDPTPRRFEDVNAVAAGFLRDLAYAQAPGPRMFGYKRAAASILALDEPLTSLVLPGRRLAKIPGIGPASERVILEVLDSGSSPTVERAVAQSDRSADVARRRGLRSHFLSRAEVLRILRDAPLHQRMSQAARRSVEQNFQRAPMVSRYEETYRRALNGTSSP